MPFFFQYIFLSVTTYKLVYMSREDNNIELYSSTRKIFGGCPDACKF